MLIIIVPYRDREAQKHIFIPHMKAFLSRKNIEYKINIEYDDTQHIDTGKFKYDKKLWENIIIFRNAKILPLLGCSKCITQQKILKYDYIFEQFILSSLYLNNIIKKK